VTHLDLLDELDEIKVCTAYKMKKEHQPPEGKKSDEERCQGRLPASIREFGMWEAEFEKLKGWKADTKKAS